MSCECKKACFQDKKKYVKGGKYQLKKKVVTDKKEEEVNVYPVTLMGNIYDEYTGKGLDQIMFMTNHIYLTYDESFACTMKKIPKGFRRSGLYVTIGYPTEREFKTYVYIGDTTITCEEIQLEKNWLLLTPKNIVDSLSEVNDKITYLETSIKYIQEKTSKSIRVESVTKAEYDNLNPKDYSVLYLIKDL